MITALQKYAYIQTRARKMKTVVLGMVSLRVNSLFFCFISFTVVIAFYFVK